MRITIAEASLRLRSAESSGYMYGWNSMTKVVINGRFLGRKPTGVDRFATELLKVIDHWSGTNAEETCSLDFEILVPQASDLYWRPKHIKLTKTGNLKGHMWEQVSLWARARRKSRRTVLLSLCNTGPVLVRDQIVAIHDATPVRVPASYSFGFRTFYRSLMSVLGVTAKRIVTVSNFSKGELAECYGIDAAKIRVVPNSGEQLLKIQADSRVIERFSLGEFPYVLAVATKAKHKNVEVLFELARRLQDFGVRIVFAGGSNDRVFGDGVELAHANVISTGFVTDGELRCLYENASCFVFPSLYEGFGIPPLEAMHAGCPVVCSNSSALPEVLGDSAAYFDPTDVHALVGAVQRILTDEKYRESMVQRGKERAAAYSWESSARQLLEVCREVI